MWGFTNRKLAVEFQRYKIVIERLVMIDLIALPNQAKLWLAVALLDQADELFFGIFAVFSCHQFLDLMYFDVRNRPIVPTNAHADNRKAAWPADSVSPSGYR